MAKVNLFLSTFQQFRILTPQLCPRAHMRGTGVDKFPYLISFPSSHSFWTPRYFPWLLSPLSSCLSDTLPASSAFLHYILVIYSSAIFNQSFTNEERKAYDNFWISDSQNSLAKYLSCSYSTTFHSLCLTSPPVIPPKLQLELSNQLRSSDQDTIDCLWPKEDTHPVIWWFIFYPLPNNFCLF